MSKEYCEKFAKISDPTTTEIMRIHCQRPGTMDKDGNPVYFTEQSHKRITDVNYIIKQYDKTGLIIHQNKIEAQYGDMTGDDYKTMLDTVIKAQNAFDELPSKIRKRFNNSPEEYLRFFEDPDNRDEAKQLGLIRADSHPDTDGLGEHVTETTIKKKLKEGEEGSQEIS